MASSDRVKEYLAYWFQLGKKVLLQDGKKKLLPQPVIEGNHYSEVMEKCWEAIMSDGGKNAYLEGTDQTVAELLSSQWEISSCFRCTMPIPTLVTGVAKLGCPCQDLELWPNTELPLPRSPVNNNAKIGKINQRLQFQQDNSKW